MAKTSNKHVFNGIGSWGWPDFIAQIGTMVNDVLVHTRNQVEGMDSVVRCIECGAEDYLPKPVKPAALRALLSRHLPL